MLFWIKSVYFLACVSVYYYPASGNHLAKDLILRAQCQCFCLREYGVDGDGVLDIYEFYQPRIVCPKEHVNCSQCLTQCRTSRDESLEQCQQHCVARRTDLLQTTEACYTGCDFIEKWRVQQIFAPEPAKSSASELMVLPTIHCQAAYANFPQESRVYVKWSVHSDRIPRNDEPNALAFAVEVRARNQDNRLTRWSTFTSVHGMVPVLVNTSTLYQFRVTPVLIDGVAGLPVLTEWIHTIPSAFRPQAPESVSIDKQIVIDDKIYILLSWKPPRGGAVCHYKLVLLPQSPLLSPIEHRIDVLPDFKYEFGPLMFGMQYQVHVSACTAEYICSHVTARTDVITLSCLQATAYNYTLCAPGALDNITTIRLSETPNRNSSWGCYVTYEINWLPAPHTDEDNRIHSYALTWRKEPVYNGYRLAPHQERNGTIRLPQNVSSFTMEGLHANAIYRITLSALSAGGQSEPRVINVNTTGTLPECRSRFFTGNAERAGGRGSSGRVLSLAVGCSLLPALGVLAMLAWAYKKQRACCKRRPTLGNESMATRRNPLYYSVQQLGAAAEPGTSETTQCDSVDQFEIEPKSLTFGKVLGQGAFGKVVKGTMHAPPGWMSKQGLSLPAVVAIKSTKDFPSPEDRQSLLQEIELMKRLGRHMNIVGMVACVTKQPKICLVMDYCSRGDLKNHLRVIRERFYPLLNLGPHKRTGSEGSRTRSSYASSRNSTDSDKTFKTRCSSGYATDGDFPPQSHMTSQAQDSNDVFEAEEDVSETRLLSYARQIATGMEYLSQKKFVHRDLAARNILVCDDHVVKISDFGLSRDVYEESLYKKRTTGKLPIKWMSIEAIFDQIYTTQSDVWSFGVVLWEIVTLGGTPYPGINNMELFSLLKDGYRMEKPDNCSDQLYELMGSCWSAAPLDRPTFTQLRGTLDGMMENSLHDSNTYLSFNLNCIYDYYTLHSEENTAASLTNNKMSRMSDDAQNECSPISATHKSVNHPTQNIARLTKEARMEENRGNEELAWSQIALEHAADSSSLANPTCEQAAESPWMKLRQVLPAKLLSENLTCDVSKTRVLLRKDSRMLHRLFGSSDDVRSRVVRPLASTPLRNYRDKQTERMLTRQPEFAHD